MIFYAIFNSIKSFKPPSVWGYLMRCATLTESPMSCYSKDSHCAEIARSPNAEGPRPAGTPRCHRGGPGTRGAGGERPRAEPPACPRLLGALPRPAGGTEAPRRPEGPRPVPPEGSGRGAGRGSRAGPGRSRFRAAAPGSGPDALPRSLEPVVSKASPSKLPSNCT